MLGLDPKAARAAWTVFLVALALYLAYLARGPIVVFVLALFFAYLLAPIVDLFTHRLTKNRSRTVALSVVYVLLVGLLLLAGWQIGARITQQAGSLASRIPELVKKQDLLSTLPLPGWLEPLRENIIEIAREQLKNLDEAALPLLQSALGKVLSQAGNVLTTVLIPVLAFFFLMDGREIRKALIAVPNSEENRNFLIAILDALHLLLGRYIRALIGLSLSTLISYTLYFEIAGVPYGVLLGSLAAALEVIPVAGPLIGGTLVMVVAGASGYSALVWLLAFLIAFRIFQDYVLAPFLMGQGVELHPLLVLFGILAGEKIAGIPGMFFSVPVIAALRILYLELRKARTPS